MREHLHDLISRARRDRLHEESTSQELSDQIINGFGLLSKFHSICPICDITDKELRYSLQHLWTGLYESKHLSTNVMGLSGSHYAYCVDHATAALISRFLSYTCGGYRQVMETLAQLFDEYRALPVHELKALYRKHYPAGTTSSHYFELKSLISSGRPPPLYSNSHCGARKQEVRRRPSRLLSP